MKSVIIVGTWLLKRRYVPYVARIQTAMLANGMGLLPDK